MHNTQLINSLQICFNVYPQSNDIGPMVSPYSTGKDQGWGAEQGSTVFQLLGSFFP